MDGNVVLTAGPVFRSITKPALSPNDIDGQINVAFQKMIRSLDAFKLLCNLFICLLRSLCFSSNLCKTPYRNEMVIDYNCSQAYYYNYFQIDMILKSNDITNKTGLGLDTIHCGELVANLKNRK
jgi:hypothetical protein